MELFMIRVEDKNTKGLCHDSLIGIFADSVEEAIELIGNNPFDYNRDEVQYSFYNKYPVIKGSRFELEAKDYTDTPSVVIDRHRTDDENWDIAEIPEEIDVSFTFKSRR